MTNEELSLIKEIEKFIVDKGKQYDMPDVMLRRSLNETWFSDTLAWLLDPKTEDDLGVHFINNFIKRVAQKRSSDEGYKRRAAFLRFGDQKSGRTVTGENRFNLNNAAVMREFYLSKFNHKKKKGSAQFADLVIFDLDKGDGIFLVIENKLFSTNHPGQLETYYDLVEDKYSSVDTREYVYLTLTGDKPEDFGNDKSNSNVLNGSWVRLSWTGDILEILQESMKGRNREEYPPDVERLVSLLSWMKEMIYNNAIRNKVEKLSDILIDNATKALTVHLNRLCAKGQWSQKENIKSSILHSSLPKRVLYIQMLPNLALTVQGKTRSKNYYEKIVVPFGAYTDQVYHLMYAAARDVYYKHFEKPTSYLNNRRNMTVSKLEVEDDIKPLLDFIYKYKYQLQVMLSVTKKFKIANYVEEIKNDSGEVEATKALKRLEPEMTQGDK